MRHTQSQRLRHMDPETVTETCPIGMEAIKVPFTHDKIKFEAVQLFKYLHKVPNAHNPVTRAEIKDEDITALNLLVESTRPLPIGRARLIASEEQLERDEMVSYLREEVMVIIRKTLLEWHHPALATMNFYTSLGMCVSNLMNIRQNMIQVNGSDEWDFLLKTLRKDYRCSLAQELFDFVDTAISSERASVPPYQERSPMLDPL